MNRLCEILGSMLFRNVSECKSQEMSYRFVLEDPRILEFVADEYKTNEMHRRAEWEKFWMLEFGLDSYNTQEMHEIAV